MFIRKQKSLPERKTITNKREQFVADIHFRDEMSLVLETIVHILAHTARGQSTVNVVDICKTQPRHVTPSLVIKPTR